MKIFLSLILLPIIALVGCNGPTTVETQTVYVHDTIYGPPPIPGNPYLISVEPTTICGIYNSDGGCYRRARRMNLTWREEPGALAYKIYAWPEYADNWQFVFSVDPWVTSAYYLPDSSNIKIDYYIKAVKSDGSETAASNVVRAYWISEY
jgi:hypothetical protein